MEQKEKSLKEYEIQVNAAGKRMYPTELKKKVLAELSAGKTTHELGRRYGIPIQNILNWKKSRDNAVMGRAPIPEGAVPLAEYRRLLEENNNLRRSLANMTLDRDILKDAVAVASKKKWL